MLSLICVLLDALLQLLLMVLARLTLHFGLDDLRNLFILEVGEPVDLVIEVLRVIDPYAAVD